MDVHKFYILLIVLFLSIPTKSFANKPERTQYDFLSLWKLKNNAFVNIDYGLPVNIVGGLLPTVKLQFIRCKPEKAGYWTMTDCQALYIPSGCHFTYEQINLLQNTTSQSINCNQHVQNKLIPNRWTEEADKKSTQVVKIQVNSDITNMKLKAFFLHCGKNLAYFNGKTLIPLCDWDHYTELVSNGNSLDVYGYINTSSVLSVIYIYYFCTITWSEMQKKPENKMRHILCPNSCSYGAVRCFGKPQVRRTVSDIRKSIMASITHCIPIGLGVFDYEYQCLCEKGYSWNSDTRSCEPEDPCTLDQILAVKANEIQEDRLCDPKGTIRCIYTQYYRNKDIFGHRIRLSLHYSCICHPQFMGYRCDRLRNSCIENNLPNRVPGNEACRTYLGNKCNSINGTNHYTCTCVGNYKHSPKYSFYNCYEQRNICDSIVCQNKGTCISSGDGKKFFCLCEYGWSGKYCTEPEIRQWLPWSPWSECSATFYANYGWKLRTRECRLLGNESIYSGKCSGNKMELRICTERFPDFTKEYLPIIKIFLMFLCYLITLHLSADIIYFLLQSERD
ncbi:unnamed protein product [Schistosoma haematobium]|nr:unnamed protein product [Schistosoma haematobium]